MSNGSATTTRAWGEPDWREPTRAEVAALLSRCVGKRVLVVGDLMLDAYVHGEVSRISPEAPVPVMRVERERSLLGGAANTAKCLAALGCRAVMCGVVGEDADGALLREEADNLGIGHEAVLGDASRRTIRKTRIIARRQQVIRLDWEDATPLGDAVVARLVEVARAAVADCEAVVVSDYSKGVVVPEVAKAVLDTARERGVPSVIDPKALPWDHYAGATILKPNRLEAGWFEQAMGVGAASPQAGMTSGAESETEAATRAEAAAVAVGSAMVERLGVEHALVTRGAEGMTQVARGGLARSFPVRLLRELADVSGCGDVVAAMLTAVLAGGGDAWTAAWLSNVAAGIKAGKFGAAAVSGNEVLESLGHGEGDTALKVMSREAAARFAGEQRERGRKVVFTNGCFDLLHVGHVDYLEKSARLGDVLVVGLNTDASVRRLKGQGRPVQAERDRARILAANAFVDAVVLFDEDTPLELIRAVRPDVLTKGADYQRKEDVVGWDVVEAYGGRVERVELVAGRSTTDLIARSRGGDASGRSGEAAGMASDVKSSGG